MRLFLIEVTLCGCIKSVMRVYELIERKWAELCLLLSSNRIGLNVLLLLVRRHLNINKLTDWGGGCLYLRETK